MNPITVLLADDHSTVRAGLRLLLETTGDIDVVGEASDGAAAVRQARALRPDVVLMDARMPGTDGVEATRQIVREASAEVLMLTTFDLDEVVFGALRAGASGFLLKSVEPVQLIDAIRRVAAGDGVVAPEVTRRLLHAFADSPSPDGQDRAAPDGLTPRETEVLGALGHGMSNAQIADAFGISTTTVKTHVSSVLAKLGLDSRMQAAIYAREAGVG